MGETTRVSPYRIAPLAAVEFKGKNEAVCLENIQTSQMHPKLILIYRSIQYEAHDRQWMAVTNVAGQYLGERDSCSVTVLKTHTRT